MGAAASTRNAAKDEAAPAAFDDDDGLTDSQYNKEFEAQLEAKRRQQKLNKGSIFGKSRLQGKAAAVDPSSKVKGQKIIGLIDSDDEEDRADREREEERDQIQALDDLNRTFGSFGLTSEAAAAKKAAAVKRQTSVDDDDENTFLTSSMSHTRFPPGTSLGRKPSLTQHRGSFAAASSKPMKFSWDEKNCPTGSRETEDWTYKKTVIEGFDPDKFRRVNRGIGPPGESSLSASVSPVPQFGRSLSTSSSTGISQPQQPQPAVPTYDSTEMKMLASLERELGVI